MAKERVNEIEKIILAMPGMGETTEREVRRKLRALVRKAAWAQTVISANEGGAVEGEAIKRFVEMFGCKP